MLIYQRVQQMECSLCWKRSLHCLGLAMLESSIPVVECHYKSKMSQYGISQYIPILGFIMGLWSKPRLWNIYAMHRNLYGFLRMKFDRKPQNNFCALFANVANDGGFGIRRWWSLRRASQLCWVKQLEAMGFCELFLDVSDAQWFSIQILFVPSVCYTMLYNVIYTRVVHKLYIDTVSSL